MSSYQCKNCGTPMQFSRDGFCSWTCRVDWKEGGRVEKDGLTKDWDKYLDMEKERKERRET